jgi:hypothetical protein
MRESLLKQRLDGVPLQSSKAAWYVLVLNRTCSFVVPCERQRQPTLTTIQPLKWLRSRFGLWRRLRSWRYPVFPSSGHDVFLAMCCIDPSKRDQHSSMCRPAKSTYQGRYTELCSEFKTQFMCTELLIQRSLKLNRDLELAERRIKALGIRGVELVNSLAEKSASSGSKPTFVEGHDLVLSMVANVRVKP